MKSSPIGRLRNCELLIGVLLGIQIVLVGVINFSSEEQISETTNTISRGLKEFTALSSKNATSAAPVESNKQQQGYIVPDFLINVTKLPTPSFDVTSISHSPNVWGESNILPQWIKDYFTWHRHQKAQITPQNWKEFRYCVMRCLTTDGKCGGTADRIKTVPWILYWAARTNRILLIHWSRPAALEAFLMPPEGGIDWRVPDWLVDHVVHGFVTGNIKNFQARFLGSNDISLPTKLQSYNGGSLYYNAYIEGPTFEEIYHDVWRSLFTPALPIQNVVRKHLERFHLQPGEYVASHLRGLYGMKNRPQRQLELMAENAIKCATTLRPEGPIFFASDSKDAIDYVIETYAPKKTTKIVALQRDYEPLHLEKSPNWENRNASEYYDTFVDLYLLSLSKCVSYNVGGYGQWALWISRNSGCSNQHGIPGQAIISCKWAGITTPEYPNSTLHEPIFLPPISDHIRIDEADESGSLDNTVGSGKNVESMASAERMTVSSHHIELWEASTKIPPWMKEYFHWHRETKSKLTKENWNETKYLVMQCLSTHDKCGGVSDRLRPIPLMLLLAARSQRLLLIQWSRPFPLEEFLVPPVGGVDWTAPDWLTPYFKTGYMTTGLNMLLPYTQKADLILKTRYQSGNHGAYYYNNQTEADSATFEEVYHDMFRVLFHPSPPVAKQIEMNLNELGLVPGEYAAAHFRVLYGRNTRPVNQTKEVAINGINCASELFPGGKVFFAADQKLAVDFVKEYAQQNNLPVVSLSHADEPLHLDKASNWTLRSPSDYYATFVDLFLLGQSRCMAYSNGGFGTFGLLLSYNSSCSVRYFSKKILKHCPRWVAPNQSKVVKI